MLGSFGSQAEIVGDQQNRGSEFLRQTFEMIENLTLYMNKVRQAAITREIIEVVSGAQAL